MVSAVGLTILLLVSAVPSPTPSSYDGPESRRAEWVARSPLSDIPSPPGTTVRGGGGGSSGDHDEWKIEIRSARDEGAVLAHYAAELSKRGFKFNAKEVEGSVALQTGTYAAADGSMWHVLLIASRGVEVEEPLVRFSIRLTRLASSSGDG